MSSEKNRANYTATTDTMLESGTSNSGESGNTKEIRKVYLFFNTLTISLGFFQFGLGMSSWSNTQDAFTNYYGWSDPDATKWGDILQSVCIGGAAVGALSCSKLLSMGKLRLLFVLNLVLCTGVALAMISKYLWLIMIGRFIWGYGFGAFSVCCAKMVNEILPEELTGPFGAINQLSLTFGASLPSTLSLAYPANIRTIPKDDFYVEQYYRIIWSLPFFVAAL